MESDKSVPPSFVAKFPDPVTIGTMVTVIGQKNNDTNFEFRLLCLPSGDEALHCDFRFNEKEVVRKYTIKNATSSKDEQKEGLWTIKESGEFEVTFWIQGEHIEIFVDRKWFVDFPHQLPYSKITHINGSVGADYTFIKFGKSTKRPFEKK